MDFRQFLILSKDDTDFDLEEADYDKIECRSTFVFEDAYLYESSNIDTEVISYDSDGSHHDGDSTCSDTRPEEQFITGTVGGSVPQ